MLKLHRMDEEHVIEQLHPAMGRSIESLENPYSMVNSNKANKFSKNLRGSATSQSINAVSNTSLPQLRGTANASPIQDSILKRKSYNDSLKISIADNQERLRIFDQKRSVQNVRLQGIL